MTRYVYDEEASRAFHMDVVHEVEERAPMSATLWIEAMRRLNVIEDPLIRRILAVHLDCGSGTGACDDMEDEGVPLSERNGWGCETTELIAQHSAVDFPRGLEDG